MLLVFLLFSFKVLYKGSYNYFFNIRQQFKIILRLGNWKSMHVAFSWFFLSVLWIDFFVEQSVDKPL